VKSPTHAGDGRPRFAHASEAEFAKILDFYGVRWEYEPRSFPLRWDVRGRAIESFNPDFYLPDLNLYIELTTLKQSLVTKKNRKLRRLRELYPDIHVKIFYGRDYRQLLLKYGIAPIDTPPQAQDTGQAQAAAQAKTTPEPADGPRQEGTARPLVPR
jgi:hypoxanthine phosphoribosyltransferase